ncbi:hypothetical protein IAR55_005271 [Kwoniella newhampshirensis]|uniref:Argonaute n=1 Tax=Kwoniella newhampshirensis TaxID=1651941 RepID=A0AAW0YYY8_9TREE
MSSTNDPIPVLPDMQALSIRSNDDLAEYAPRPDFGRQGKAIHVQANMFQVKLGEQGMSIYHYDIDIAPVGNFIKKKKKTDNDGSTNLRRDLCWKIWKQLVQEAPAGPVKQALEVAAYDQQKSFYTPVKIPLTKEKAEIPVTLNDDPNQDLERRKRFRVTIQFVRLVDMSTILDYCKGLESSAATKAMAASGKAAINTLLRQDLNERFSAKGASGTRFFGLDSASTISSGGVVLKGFMQSFLTVQAGLSAVQLDTAYGPFFRSGPLLSLLTEILERRGGGGRFSGRGGDSMASQRPPSLDVVPYDQYSKLHRLLRHAKFTVAHRKTAQTFTFKGFTTDDATTHRFIMEGRNGAPDSTTTVQQYYRSQYNIHLTKPRLPLVMYGEGKVVPIEFVMLRDFNAIPFGSITPDQTAEMIKVAAKPPPQRQAEIMGWRRTIDYSALPKLKAWGVSVEAQMMRIPARVLTPPSVSYSGGKQLRVNNGAWNVRGVKFAKAGNPLMSWSICCFDRVCTDEQIRAFFKTFIIVLQQTGCPVANVNPTIVRHEGSDVRTTLQGAAREAFFQSRKDPQLMIVIVPFKDLGFYSMVKRICTTEMKKPVVSQIMQSMKIRSDRGVDQYCGNMSMKIHAKVGGVTHQVPVPQLLDQTTMMIGADVTHPPQGVIPIPPSIAVSVAAVNGSNNQFVPAIRLQNGRQELIEDLKDMTKTHIRLFERNSKAKPQKIVMFRDGVSEGQYGQCAEIERSRILDACRELDPKYRPKITFVICAKRHNMRFFATSEQDKDRTGNLPPGTCVDSHVTHPYAFDFYLQAHAGLQGTARPTHYVVVSDENGFTADKMQNLCNSLSYSYARSARAVSIVPVAYYADIIAGKARDFIYSDDSDDGTTISGSSGAVYAHVETHKLRDRLEADPLFNHVAWYM